MSERALDGDYWSVAGGDVWVSLQALTDRLYAPVADALLTRLAPEGGQQVLDIGCGAGVTTLETAARLGAGGVCVGVDISDPLLDLARQRAATTRADNAVFLRGDAQMLTFDRSFDAALSRFGVMFFADPVAAFSHIRGALKPGGRLVFASWRGPADNPLAALPNKALALSGITPPLPPKDGPGRFAFADADKVRNILADAGWTHIDIAPLDVPTPATVAEMVVMGLKLGVVGDALANADAATRDKVAGDMAVLFEREAVNGVVPLEAACWLVEAVA